MARRSGFLLAPAGAPLGVRCLARPSAVADWAVARDAACILPCRYLHNWSRKRFTSQSTIWPILHLLEEESSIAVYGLNVWIVQAILEIARLLPSPTQVLRKTSEQYSRVYGLFNGTTPCFFTRARALVPEKHARGSVRTRRSSLMLSLGEIFMGEGAGA
jgi:hypothetical protein